MGTRMKTKLGNVQNRLRTIVCSLNNDLEKTNMKILNMRLKNMKTNMDTDIYLEEIHEKHLNNIYRQRQSLLKNGLVLLNSIDEAINSDMNEVELKKFYLETIEDVELLVG